jgi:hypothetical protein
LNLECRDPWAQPVEQRRSVIDRVPRGRSTRVCSDSVFIPPLPALITLRAGDVLYAYGYRTDARGMTMRVDLQSGTFHAVSLTLAFSFQGRGTIAFSQSFN